MSRIETCFKDGETIFETKLRGISLTRLKKFCQATEYPVGCYRDKTRGSYYIPGVMIISMFRHLVEKIAKEDDQFPLKKISSFYGSNGGTKENRVFINENLTYRLKILSNDGPKKVQFRVEVSRSPKDIVLAGIFIFCE